MPHGDFVLPVMFQATALKEHKYITSRMIATMSKMVYQKSFQILHHF